MKEKKGNIVFKIFIILLVLIAGVVIGFCMKTYLDKGSEEVEKKTKESATPEEESALKEEIKNLSIIDPTVELALETFESIGTSAENKYDFNIDKINTKELIMTVILSLEHEKINYCVGDESQLQVGMTIDEWNEQLQKIVQGKKITVDDIKENKNKETSYSVGGNGYATTIKNGTKVEYSIVIKEDKLYIVGACGYEGPNKTTIITKTEKAEEIGDKLHIYQKVAFGKTEYDESQDGFVYDCYADKEYRNKVERININADLTWNKYKTVELIFEKKEDNYYFISSKTE